MRNPSVHRRAQGVSRVLGRERREHPAKTSCFLADEGQAAVAQFRHVARIRPPCHFVLATGHVVTRELTFSLCLSSSVSLYLVLERARLDNDEDSIPYRYRVIKYRFTLRNGFLQSTRIDFAHARTNNARTEKRFSTHRKQETKSHRCETNERTDTTFTD